MLTERNPQVYRQSEHWEQITVSMAELWERITSERPDLTAGPGPLRPVILKCSQRHNVMAVELHTHENIMGELHPVSVPTFGIRYVAESPEVVALTSTPDPQGHGVTAELDETTGVLVDTPAEPQNEVKERVTVRCPHCRGKRAGRNIVVKGDRLLLLYMAALVEGRKSVVIE